MSSGSQSLLISWSGECQLHHVWTNNTEAGRALSNLHRINAVGDIDPLGRGGCDVEREFRILFVACMRQAVLEILDF